jgi:hypothetical protein
MLFDLKTRILHRFYFMLVESSLWLTVAQLKMVYVHHMQAAAENMVMYNNNLSTALVVSTQTITPQAIVSSGTVPVNATATAALPRASAVLVAVTSPDKRSRGQGKGGKVKDRATHSGSRRSRSRSPGRSSSFPRRSEVCEVFNFDRRGCFATGCRKVHRCLKCNSRDHG